MQCWFYRYSHPCKKYSGRIHGSSDGILRSGHIPRTPVPAPGADVTPEEPRETTGTPDTAGIPGAKLLGRTCKSPGFATGMVQRFRDE
jgi:hypothetical protein